MKFLLTFLLSALCFSAGAVDYTALLASASAWTATNSNPYITILGDSIPSGYTNYHTAAYADGGPSGNTNANIAMLLRGISGGQITATNLAAAGRKVQGIIDYDFLTAGDGGSDVWARPPKFIVLRVGINDITAGYDWFTQSRVSMNKILTNCVAHNTTLILCSILPFNNTAPIWNGYYQTWCATNAAIYCDQYSLLEDTGANTNKLQAQFTFDTQHLTLLGHAWLATNTYDFFGTLFNAPSAPLGLLSQNNSVVWSAGTDTNWTVYQSTDQQTWTSNANVSSAAYTVTAANQFSPTYFKTAAVNANGEGIASSALQWNKFKRLLLR